LLPFESSPHWHLTASQSRFTGPVNNPTTRKSRKMPVVIPPVAGVNLPTSSPVRYRTPSPNYGRGGSVRGRKQSFTPQPPPKQSIQYRS
jgi:hypothetical protein